MAGSTRGAGARGLGVKIDPGPLLLAHFESERVISPSYERLSWMLLNAHRLIPRDGGNSGVSSGGAR